jgi:protein-disulfide isomerase
MAPRRQIPLLALSGALAIAVPAAARAADAAAPLPQAEIERIVKEYLLREPEVVYQAIQELQRRRELAEAKRQQETIVARRADLFAHPDDPVAGDPEGDVTLVEFFDYHCGYCRAMAGGLQDLITTDRRLRFVMKDLPVLGPDSVVAAKAALAVRLQGKYTPFHFALMRSKDLSKPSIEAVAREVGIDVERMNRDMQSEAIARTIDANLALARDLGIGGTPSFVIGDRLIPGAIDLAQLAQLIDEQRRAGN